MLVVIVNNHKLLWRQMLQLLLLLEFHKKNSTVFLCNSEDSVRLNILKKHQYISIKLLLVGVIIVMTFLAITV